MITIYTLDKSRYVISEYTGPDVTRALFVEEGEIRYRYVNYRYAVRKLKEGGVECINKEDIALYKRLLLIL